MRAAVLLTCFNRKELTRRCLQSIYKYKGTVETDIYVVNDGCTDGTPEMVASEFPDVKLLEGDGSLFWNGGMHLAFSEAVKKNYDFYLWVNDDVEFIESPLDTLIDAYNLLSSKKEELIVVAPMLDKERKRQTYGGIRVVKSFVPLKMAQVNYKDKPIKCDTFHGNCVLIHRSVVDRIGVNDSFYQHAFGDADYGLQATRNGCEVWLSNHPVGICERHDKANKWNDPALSCKERLAAYHAKTANPPRDWKYFCKKFCGWNWWLRYIAPDIKIIILSVLKK